MIDAPKIVNTREQMTAVIYQVIPAADVRKVMGPTLAELKEALAQQGISPTGPWFTHHMKKPDAHFDFEVGFPVAQGVKPAGRMKPSKLPATRVARTIYRGPYEGLGAGWGELMAWIETQGHQPLKDLWECYVVGPWTESDPGKWETELNRPIGE